jgi:hypothetical protein
VQGKYWLLKDQPTCKLELPATNGTFLCLVTDYGCTVYPTATCHTRVTAEGTEVLMANNYWKSEQLGPEWSQCTSELYQSLDSVPLCS